MIKALSLVAVLSLSGCNYQVGDGTVAVVRKINEYCHSTDAITKAMLLVAIRVVIPTWQPVCPIKESIYEVLQEPQS